MAITAKITKVAITDDERMNGNGWIKEITIVELPDGGPTDNCDSTRMDLVMGQDGNLCEKYYAQITGKFICGYDHGSYEASDVDPNNEEYKKAWVNDIYNPHRFPMYITSDNVPGFQAASNVATIMSFLGEEQNNEIAHFLNTVWE
jgi:hypothetical protein